MATKQDSAVSAKAPAAPPTLRDQFDRMFDTMLRGWPQPWRDAPRLDFATLDFSPKVETGETATAFDIAVELPGVDEKDVKVTIDSGMLTIAGEKKALHEEKQRDSYVCERSYGGFQRSFRLPDNIAEDKVSAAFEKGVLKVTLPKKAPTADTSKTIAIGKP